MYRNHKSAHSFSHSVYIKSIDATLWRLVLTSAARNGVSVSRFVNHALWLFMVGTLPDEPKRGSGQRRKRGVRSGGKRAKRLGAK